MAWPSHFDKLSVGGCTLYIHKDFRNEPFEQTLLADRRELHERYYPVPVRSSRFTDVYRFGVRFGSVEKVVYFKEYFYRSWWDFVKHFFRSSRAKRAMEAGFMLAENGFESPYVIAMGHRNFAFLTTRSFVVTLEVENSRSVYQFVSAGLQERRSFVRAFGRTIGRLHADGIFHGDLRLGNVLAREEQDGWHIFFLDNERTKRFRRLPARLRLKNLVQINMFEPGAASNTDRMRFFKEYWAENKESVEKASLIKKVMEKTGRRLRKKMRSDV
jgi:tRNA A-37 threonylcarbamoyl transferase component Bud32